MKYTRSTSPYYYTGTFHVTTRRHLPRTKHTTSSSHPLIIQHHTMIQPLTQKLCPQRQSSHPHRRATIRHATFLHCNKKPACTHPHHRFAIIPREIWATRTHGRYPPPRQIPPSFPPSIAYCRCPYPPLYTPFAGMMLG